MGGYISNIYIVYCNSLFFLFRITTLIFTQKPPTKYNHVTKPAELELKKKTRSIYTVAVHTR